MKTSTTLRSKKLLKVVVATLFWFLVWLLCALAINKELILPSPLLVISKMFSMVTTAVFWQHTFVTFLRIIIGYILGVAIAVALAMLTYNYEICDAIISPVIRIIRATPVASFIILVLLWAGKNYLPSIIVALMVIPVVWENLVVSYQNTDENLIEMALAYRLSKMKQFFHIRVPAAFTAFSSAALTAMGLAWKSGIAAEVLAQPKIAIGTQLYYSKIYLETSELFAWTFVVVLMSLCIEKLVVMLLAGRKDNEN